MFFVSKKKYDALLKQKEEFERIVTLACAQNDGLLDAWKVAIEEMKNIQKLNHQLSEHNDKLLARVQELEATLNFVIEQRDHYCDLLKNTRETEEEGED
jgi:hypothetical protein